MSKSKNAATKTPRVSAVDRAAGQGPPAGDRDRHDQPPRLSPRQSEDGATTARLTGMCGSASDRMLTSHIGIEEDRIGQLLNSSDKRRARTPIHSISPTDQ